MSRAVVSRLGCLRPALTCRPARIGSGQVRCASSDKGGRLVPMYFDDFFDRALRDVSRTMRTLENSFWGPRPGDLLGRIAPRPFFYREPFFPTQGSESLPEVKVSDHKVEIDLDMQSFKPEEIKVTLSDRDLTIEAKHEERSEEHGTVSRHVVRRFALPEDCDPEQVNSLLTTEGHLKVTAPRNNPDAKPPREVNIQLEKPEEKKDS